MKELCLTQGYKALVDTEDYERLTLHSWHVHKTKAGLYARASIQGNLILLHRFILRLKSSYMGAPIVVDHKDTDGLNNQKENLQIVSRRYNSVKGKVPSNNSMQIRGVYCDKTRQKYRAYYYYYGVQTTLYWGVDFFEACCARKSWENRNL